VSFFSHSDLQNSGISNLTSLSKTPPQTLPKGGLAMGSLGSFLPPGYCSISQPEFLERKYVVFGMHKPKMIAHNYLEKQ
jgi:hypothetical protein